MTLFLQEEPFFQISLLPLHEIAKTKGECNTCHMYGLYMPHVHFPYSSLYHPPHNPLSCKNNFEKVKNTPKK